MQEVEGRWRKKGGCMRRRRDVESSGVGKGGRREMGCKGRVEGKRWKIS